MKRWLKIAVIIIIAGSAGFAVYKRVVRPDATHGGAAMMMGMGGPAPVDAAVVAEREVQVWQEFSGRLTAAERADVRPQVSGMIEEVLFTDGAPVNKGDLLFRIDPRPYRAAADQAKAALSSAQAQADLTTREFRRAETLYKDRTIPERDYEKRRNERNAASAQVESAKAALEIAEINLGYTDVRAPIAGRAGRTEITAGNIVQAGPGAPVLTTVVADKPVYADFEMDESSFLHYARQKNGNVDTQIPVMLGLSSEDGTPHEGHVLSFDNSLDPASGTIRVRAVFANDDGALVPGLFARIRIGNTGSEKAVLITDRAIGTDQDKKFVLAIDADNKVEYREIRPGALVDGLRAIESGLKPGDKIIVSGLQRARPGMPVAPQMVDMLTGQPTGGAPAPAANAQP